MSKLISLSNAISKYVQDGDSLYAAGFTHLIPFAAGHEIIRQNKRDLILARATPDLIYDQMVAAGCAKKVIFSYMGNPGVGSLRIVRGALEHGEIQPPAYEEATSRVPYRPLLEVDEPSASNRELVFQNRLDVVGHRARVLVLEASRESHRAAAEAQERPLHLVVHRHVLPLPLPGVAVYLHWLEAGRAQQLLR